ncbi:MAG: hypothetical protein COY40_06815 [Alphaproteobacteria bacterium CG_4_10_14_0_8_um_filter_53_9]|nr:MAG: hypothetical protein COY40_06815 [Alphaproteobacteria bacterium CG_4_10_14_0_8_um_filter_53_9]
MSDVSFFRFFGVHAALLFLGVLTAIFSWGPYTTIVADDPRRLGGPLVIIMASFMMFGLLSTFIYQWLMPGVFKRLKWISAVAFMAYLLGVTLMLLIFATAETPAFEWALHSVVVSGLSFLALLTLFFYLARLFRPA